MKNVSGLRSFVWKIYRMSYCGVDKVTKICKYLSQVRPSKGNTHWDNEKIIYCRSLECNLQELVDNYEVANNNFDFCHFSYFIFHLFYFFNIFKTSVSIFIISSAMFSN